MDWFVVWARYVRVRCLGVGIKPEAECGPLMVVGVGPRVGSQIASRRCGRSAFRRAPMDGSRWLSAQAWRLRTAVTIGTRADRLMRVTSRECAKGKVYE